MIKISKQAMGLEGENGLFITNSFVERDGCFYFVSQSSNEDEYVCVKITKDNKIEFVRVYVSEEQESDGIIVKEQKIEEVDEIDNLLNDFFDYLRYEDNEEDVNIKCGIVEVLGKVSIEPYCYSDGNMLYCEFYNIFTLEGEVVEGYYEGNLVVTNIKLINEITRQEIKQFERANLASNFHISEEDEDYVDYMISSYLESMGTEEIKGVFKHTGIFI